VPDTDRMMEDRRARFEALVGEVSDPVQRYLLRRARPDVADDVLGDVLLVLWRRLDDVPVDDPIPWSIGTARRALANRRRSDRRKLALVDRIRAIDPPTVAADPSASGDHPELVAALAGLPETDREVLVLWAWEGFEPRELATVLGISDNAAANRLSRARRRLATALGRQESLPAGQDGYMDAEEDRI
jgi:RNA polymerase sigma-70 factor (ECF subfamily)